MMRVKHKPYCWSTIPRPPDWRLNKPNKFSITSLHERRKHLFCVTLVKLTSILNKIKSNFHSDQQFKVDRIKVKSDL